MQLKTEIRPLTTEEKQKLKSVFKARIIIGLFFSPFILFGTSFLLIGSINDIRDGTGDSGSYFGLALVSIIVFLIVRYVIPFYKRSFENTRRQNKLVIKTVVLAITQRSLSNYIIDTGFRKIDNFSISIIMQTSSLYLNQLYVNMPVTIHCFEDNKTDILYIEKTAEF